MQKHIKEIATIIDSTRQGEESFLHDSTKAAEKIALYIGYHFEIKAKEKFDFSSETLI